MPAIPAPTTNHPAMDDRPTAGRNTELSSQDRSLLEAACVDLICRLDQLLCHANEARQAGYLNETVPHANNMLLASLDFAESHLTGSALDELHTQVAAAYGRTQELADLISSRSWGAVRRVIGRPSATEMDVLRVHGEVGEAIAVVVVASLGGGIRRLGVHTSIGDEMIQSLKLFLSEMKKAW